MLASMILVIGHDFTLTEHQSEITALSIKPIILFATKKEFFFFSDPNA